MENNKVSIKFKTNINCGGCIATVTPFLDGAVGADNWKVDTTDPSKILTVQTEDKESVKEAVQKAGFKIEEVAA